MLIIAGHFHVDPSRRNESLTAFADLVRRARQADGCLDITVAPDALDLRRTR